MTGESRSNSCLHPKDLQKQGLSPKVKGETKIAITYIYKGFPQNIIVFFHKHDYLF